MKAEILNIIKTVSVYSEKLLDILRSGRDTADEFGKKVQELKQFIEEIEQIIEPTIYGTYKEFFDSFKVFCYQCRDAGFLIENVADMDSSLELFGECIEALKEDYLKKIKKCVCCGNEGVYAPLPQYYKMMEQQYGVSDDVANETLSYDEYLCPACGANDRDRLIISFFEKEGLKTTVEGTKLLQIAPAKTLENWIVNNCPQIEYETTDLFMEGVTFKSDIQDMHMVESETYDIIICSHVLEHVQDDRKALREMKRILKQNGKLVFLVPIDLNSEHIDEEWGLSEAENWRRFGQGDHCRRYGRDGLIERLEEVFFVHALGKEYFGEHIFEQGGLTDTSTLYVLTKEQDVPLNMAEEYVIDKELCMNGPLVSVIMSCYNHEKYVAEAIESVLNQSYKNIEFIVADDCSTDNSVEVMKQYSQFFAKEFYYTENIGGRFAMLRQYATGKYVALMNSDDVWEADKLAVQVKYMEEHEECGACFTWCNYTDENLQIIPDNIFIKRNRARHEWMRFFWDRGNALCNPSSLVRRELRLRPQRYGGTCWQLPDFFWWVDLIQLCDFHIVTSPMVKMRRYQSKNLSNVSVISKETQIRDIVETGCNWIWVLRDMEDDFFKKCFGDIMINKDAETTEEIKCEKFFLMLKNPNVFVQNSAFLYLSDVFNEIQKCMEEKYQYSYKQIKDDIVNKGIAQFFK